MSIKIREKMVKTIEDTRGLSVLEVMGLIYSHASLNEKEDAFLNTINSSKYEFKCNVEQKSTIIIFYNNNTDTIVTYTFYPAYQDGIFVECVSSNFPRYSFIISIEDLEDLTI